MAKDTKQTEIDAAEALAAETLAAEALAAEALAAEALAAEALAAEALAAEALAAEALAAEALAAEALAAEALAAEALAAEQAGGNGLTDWEKLADAEAQAARAKKVTATSTFDLRDPYVVVAKPEDAWLRAGVPKKVELTNWLQAQIEAGYVSLAKD